MRIAVLQSNPVTGAVEHNAGLLFAAMREATDLGAELCVAPELFLCGPVAGDLLLQRGFAEECARVLEGLALDLYAAGITAPLLVGAPFGAGTAQGYKLYNAALMLRQGKVEAVATKKSTFRPDRCGMSRYFASGTGIGFLEMQGARLGIALGEDLWETPAPQTAQAIVHMTALPFVQGAVGSLPAHAGSSVPPVGVPLLSANLVGGQEGFVFHGGSQLLAADGTLRARAPFCKECVFTVEMGGEACGACTPFSQAGGTAVPPFPTDASALWQALVLGTRDFVRKSGFSRVVLGLSGGIDSALVAAIAVEALGRDNVAGLLMPSPYSSRGSVDDSLALARNLGIATHTIPIGSVMGSYEAAFGAVFPRQGLTGLAEENIQSRIRGALLMTYANTFQALLLATGNKSEVAVGYCTLYGDLAGALGPIGDVYKTQVFSLCRWYNAHYGERIPPEIITKPPSAELRDGQKDEDSLPPYDLLDSVLEGFVEHMMSKDSLMAAGYEPEVVRRVAALLEGAEFKRRQAPPFLCVSRRSFGVDWRLPLARTVG